MKKIINRKNACVVLLCVLFSGCGNDRTVWSDVESAYNTLSEKTNISYEYTMTFSQQGDTSKLMYLVDRDDTAHSWSYSTYLDDMPVTEFKCEQNSIYQKIGDEWKVIDTTIEPPFPTEIVPDIDQIDRMTVSKSEDSTEIMANMNDDFLRKKEIAIIDAGTKAIDSMDELGVPQEALAEQQRINEESDTIHFISDTRYYKLDENGQMYSCLQLVEYEEGADADNVTVCTEFKIR